MQTGTQIRLKGSRMQRLMNLFSQVGEIEEQLMSARRELARSEEANQKLQRDVKEVRPAGIKHSIPLTGYTEEGFLVVCGISCQSSLCFHGYQSDGQ